MQFNKTGAPTYSTLQFGSTLGDLVSLHNLLNTSTGIVHANTGAASSVSISASGVTLRSYSSQVAGTAAIQTGVFTLDLGGNAMLLTPNGGLGYGTGAGGTVTQATSKSNAVTLNKPCGQITMHNAALAANGVAYFQLTNVLLVPGDILMVNFGGAAANLGAYNVWCDRVDTGSAFIAIKNISGASLSQAVIINFAIIKGAIL